VKQGVDFGDRGYPRTFAEKVDPRHTAVRVADMQNEFCAPDGHTVVDAADDSRGWGSG
jgi:hypothetical protein